MDDEKLKILEMVANRIITPEEAAKLLEEKKDDTINFSKETTSSESIKTESKKYENEEQIDVSLELGVTNFRLYKGDKNKLYKIDYNESEGLTHRVIFVHNELQLTNDLKKPTKFDLLSLKKFVDPTTKKCFVELNPNVKLYMKVKFGGGKADLDFTDLKIKRLRLSSGASDTRITFNRPNPEELDYLKIESGASNLNMSGISNTNCSEMDINLGACNASLDFSGEIEKDMYVEISMRVGKLNLLVPSDTGIKIKVSERLGDINLPDFVVKEGFRVSKNIESVKRVLNLRVESTLAQVNLVWI